MLRKFRNRSEDKMQRQIRAAIERHGAELHEKVRIADVLDINKLDKRGLGTYALQAHFDFVLIDENELAVVAIEFDGAGHDSRNDAKKNSICQQANLPLIRVYGFEEVREIKTFTLTRYLVELVLHAKLFLQMQNDGTIGHDEPFVLSGFLKRDAQDIFDSEFDFIRNTNGKLTRALQKGGLAVDSLPHLSISQLVIRAPEGRLRAFMTIDTSKGPIIGTASLRVTLASPGFLAELWTVPLEIAQFAAAMAADDLLENIRRLVEGRPYAITKAQKVLAELRTLGLQGYKLAMGGGCTRSEANLMAAFAEEKEGKQA